MTWEQITKQYEQDSKIEKSEDRRAKFDKNWNNLVRSTDKLVWLFSLSNGGRPQFKR